MINILIVPDIKGWATDSMAKNIIKNLSDKYNFTIKYPNEFKYPDDYENYDIIYIMISGYIGDKTDKKYYHKIRTTFHGGPGTEGQADKININGQRLIKTSYVSSEVNERVKSYKLPKMYFTPHGVNTDKFDKNNKITKIKTFGFAGHARYLIPKNNQEEHRRGDWIIRAQHQLKFDLKIAGGMPNYPENVIKFNEMYPNIDCKSYNRNDMVNFYKSIDCYLIPDLRAGGPMPALEAGAMNIPLITANCGLIKDCFINKKHGLLIKDYGGFEKAITWMKNNQEEAIQMGKNWGDYVRKNRDWKSVIDKWEKFLIV